MKMLSKIAQLSITCRRPHIVLQTFSYNFCRCVVCPNTSWPPQATTPLFSQDRTQIENGNAVTVMDKDSIISKSQGESPVGISSGEFANDATQSVTIIAMSGSEPADVELWAIEVS